MKIALATNNAGKAREIAHILGNTTIELHLLKDFPGVTLPPEDAPDFKGNALIKARTLCKATGLTSIADDSGLEVDFLGGRPGVHSARYAGENATDEENNAKLLKELERAPKDKRTARFHCVIALVFPNREEHTFDGSYEGMIIGTPRGTKGFGYDPLFVPIGTDKTAAELTPEVKNSISHRAKALEKLKGFLTIRNILK